MESKIITDKKLKVALKYVEYHEMQRTQKPPGRICAMNSNYLRAHIKESGDGTYGNGSDAKLDGAMPFICDVTEISLKV